ncbi:hypothetical protein CPL00371_CDS0016 [Klebsiella phage MegaDucksbill]|uniref:Uncharacterized protein n=1 Tax=Klebsiella phage MegaDucksbill TaxID=3098260 RepID=A0ABZ2ENP8_9CAUD
MWSYRTDIQLTLTNGRVKLKVITNGGLCD